MPKTITKKDVEAKIANPDIAESVSDLLDAAKLVVARWDNGNLAEAITNLNLVVGWLEAAIEDARPAKANLAVVLDGGLVQCVVTDNPDAVKGINAMVIDYDVDSPDPDDECLGLVLQQDGSLEPAYMRGVGIEPATIDLGQVEDFTTDKACGSAQQRVAVMGNYPCDGCLDVNLDGSRCVNEAKCLAFTFYQEGPK